MIIHMWMHWFWITTSSFKCFLLFAVQMISLSCISHPSMSEAGLLDNNISTHLDFHNINNSSQIVLDGGNITSVREEVNVTSVVGVTSDSPTASSILETSVESLTSQVAAATAVAVAAASRSEVPVFEETVDSKDTYNGDNLETLHYPVKKVAKYSQVKLGKMTVKPTSKEESAEEGEKVETVNVVEEKVKINISLHESVGGKNESGVGESLKQETSSEATESGLATADASVENATLNDINVTEEIPQTTATTTTTATTMTVSSSSQPSTNTSGIAEVTEDPKDADLKNETLVIENKVEESVIRTTVEPFVIQNRVAAATSAHNFESDQARLNAGSITGITLGILVVFSLFGAVSFVLYRRRYLNKPQVLHDKCSNLDSSGYIDDTSLREHSEEMYSLDNDSFLNSLEAMTIQNYWTESVKHTKL